MMAELRGVDLSSTISTLSCYGRALYVRPSSNSGYVTTGRKPDTFSKRQAPGQASSNWISPVMLPAESHYPFSTIMCHIQREQIEQFLQQKSDAVVKIL
ncbi:hypothetical protein F2P81_013528 [Scophthalmus maximus]|uniref:Uncharacterized protein n=1 Tax=Scophthalmus maximus TaxID=52904 RepID=A0A6A4STM4_SCOMX|nr:hypothetical protein F2P81_013528 [Scophthalmus maximus]